MKHQHVAININEVQTESKTLKPAGFRLGCRYRDEKTNLTCLTMIVTRLRMVLNCVNGLKLLDGLTMIEFCTISTVLSITFHDCRSAATFALDHQNENCLWCSKRTGISTRS